MKKKQKILLYSILAIILMISGMYIYKKEKALEEYWDECEYMNVQNILGECEY
ncbi:hypothetical protein [Bacillus sp. ISL-39]|uniref:hypothetical protein n=1 Tax=Bacillus sp. ISL-39 TaxID=2819124 RepID=UPI001BE67A0D|nr:hypothetical protein [Bacillus sp. ISL-39]MBT2636439.1 hypothetical protein [Bacillus sp. ISL-39]